MNAHRLMLFKTKQKNCRLPLIASIKKDFTKNVSEDLLNHRKASQLNLSLLILSELSCFSSIFLLQNCTKKKTHSV